MDAFVLIEDETLRSESLALVQALRDAGRTVEFPLTPAKSDKQFKRALELGAARSVRLERSPNGPVTARVKELSTRTETVLPAAEALAHLVGQA